MQTKRWNVTEDDAGIAEAASFIQQGLTVAFPTETVYGLGADATNEQAVAKIFQAKRRPVDNPLIVHVATVNQLQRLVSHLPAYVEQLIDQLTPGPLTFVLPSNGTCAPNVTAGLPTVAVRIPSHPVAQQLMRSANLPIAAPSANISGKPSPTTADHVWEDLAGHIGGLLDGGKTGFGLESTVLDCTKETPVILRPGSITREQIEAVIGPIHVYTEPKATEQVPSPGMKYKHYSPAVPLILVRGEKDRLQEIINEEQARGKRVGLLASTSTIQQVDADQRVDLGADLDTIATRLYQALRSFDKTEVEVIICEAFPEQGLGLAIMNRLRKAAEKIIS